MSEQQSPPAEAGFFTTIRGWGLTRSDARVVAGVGGGIAERLGWSRGWTRVGIVAAAILLNGLGLLAYAAAWALLPDRQGRIVAQDFGRGVPNVGALIGIGVIGLLGFIGFADGPDPWNWSPVGDVLGGDVGGGIFRGLAIMFAILVPLALLVGAAFLIAYLVRRNRPGGPWGHGGPGAGPHGPGRMPGGEPVYAAPPAWAAERQRARAQAAEHARAATAEAYATAAEATQEARAAVDESLTEARRATDEAAQAWRGAVPGPMPGHAPGAPYQGQPWQARPAPVPAPPRPPARPRVPGPGGGFWLLTLAWAVLSGAAAAWAAWDQRLAVHPMVAWFALFLTGLGVILVLIALSGRRLGFLAFASGVLAIPALLAIAGSDQIRDDWAGRYLPDVEVRTDADGVTRIQIGEGEVVIGEGGVSVTEPSVAVDEPSPDADVDALSVFDGDYARITLPAGCYASEDAPDPGGLSRGLVDYSDLAEPATETLSAGFTTVRVPAGASVEIAADESTYGTVHWASRDLTCDLQADAGITLTNPEAPVLTLDLSNPVDGMAVVVIEEVAS